MDQIYHFPQLRGEILHQGAPSSKEFASLFFHILGGILVVSGRLRKPGIPLLHKDSLLAKLWLQHLHDNVLHHAGGASTLKAEANTRFWVWKGTYLYKSSHTFLQPLHSPQITRHYTTNGSSPDHTGSLRKGPLPLLPLVLTSLGPWYTDQGRCPETRRELPRRPRYLLVFGCLTFRAIHLEMTYGHSTQDVLEALQRFASRRSVPIIIVSDNAKELKKAAEVLTNCSRLDQVDLPVCPTWGEVKWTFSHPRAPHTNGATESLVGSSKKGNQTCHPKALLNRQPSTDDLYILRRYCKPETTGPSSKQTYMIPQYSPQAISWGHSRGPLPPTTEHGDKEQIHYKVGTGSGIRDKFYKDSKKN